MAGVQAGTPLPWRLQAEHAGGGLFLDLGCHTLDILDFICGPLEEVRGAAANLGTPCAVEDTVALTFRTGGGALGTAQWLFAAAERADEIVDQRRARRAAAVHLRQRARRAAPGRRVDRFDLPNPPHIQQPMIQSIVDELRGRGTCASTGVSAARTSAIIDTVLLDYYGTRDDGFWRAPESWPGNRARRRGAG